MQNLFKALLLLFVVLGVNQLCASESFVSRAIEYIKSSGVLHPIFEAQRVSSDDNYLKQFLGDYPKKLVQQLIQEEQHNPNLQIAVNNRLSSIGVAFRNVPRDIWLGLSKNVPFALHNPNRNDKRPSLSSFIFAISASYFSAWCVYKTMSHLNPKKSDVEKEDSKKKSIAERMKFVFFEAILPLGSFGIAATILTSAFSIDYINQKVISSLVESAVNEAKNIGS